MEKSRRHRRRLMVNILCARIRYIVPFMFCSETSYDKLLEEIAKNSLWNIQKMHEQDLFQMILSDGYDVENIIKNISLIDPSKKFIANRTLIIFDELQELPDIATSLKAFKLDGRFDVICSGSLLGINYAKIHSNSVGYKTDYEMFSMDFEEVLWAKRYSEISVLSC